MTQPKNGTLVKLLAKNGQGAKMTSIYRGGTDDGNGEMDRKVYE
jgi:hypothetical protein